ncbi:JAB domain-containing protein [Brevundimonas sp.]|uniref:JAB domain-containing protein n=1 Tax=Brevundimonas sp. TaxID=1871086 RepID=UPI0028ACDDFF|nr:JAB domain-containing protein [Brevundimonas sp.]
MSPLAAIDRTTPISPSEEAADLHLLAAFLEDRAFPGSGRAAAVCLIDEFGGLAGVGAADAVTLARAGMSSRAVADLGRVRALALAMARDEACRRPVVSSWSALMTYLRASLAHAPREQFRALYLDKRNILMRDELRADGTVDHAPVYNSGPSRVARLGRVPDIAETRAYVAAVIDCYLALSAGRSITNSRQCRSEGATS